MSSIGIPKDLDHSLDLFGQIVKEIKQDPIAFVQANRLDQIKALKLTMPHIILAHKINRRFHYEKYETAFEEVKRRRAEIEVAIKDERDPISNKPIHRNRETRELEIIQRLERDPEYRRSESLRRQMYAQAKSFEDEIMFYEQIDQSLIEICAMMTAEIEHKTRSGEDYGNVKQRSSRRAKSRAKDIVETTFDTISGVV